MRALQLCLHVAGSGLLDSESSFLGRFLSPGSSVVVRRCTPRGRDSFGPSSTRSRPVHRRLGRRLGCVSRFHSTFGLVVSELLPIFDQLLRASGCLSRSPWLPTSALAPLGGSIPGQHHCVSISSEGGGHEIVHPQYSGSGDSPFLRCPIHPSPPTVYSGSSERVSRCSQSELPGSGLRVDPLPGGLQGFVLPLAGHSGSVCHLPYPPSASLLLTGGGSSGGRGGRNVAVLGLSSGVSVPPPPSASFHVCWPSASVAGSGAHARGSVLASQALVPGSLGAVDGDSGPPAAPSRSAPSTALSLLPSQSSRSSVDWVSHCERSTRSLGFFAPVAHQLARSRRSSTRRNYQSKWLTYRTWCHCNGRSVSAPTIPKIADFLLYLRRSLGLSCSCIASYRSVLSASFRFLLPDISSHPVLHDLLRSFRIERPLTSSRVPPWDLSLVLSLLRGAPFEPLVSCSLRDLTRKLLFLLSLVTARRVGELQAVAADVSSSGGDAFLSYLPEFRAKSESASRSFRIPSLSDFVGSLPDELLLYPVRALRIFLHRTSLSPRPRSLFLSPRSPSRSLPKNALSYFLRSVILQSLSLAPTSSSLPSSTSASLAASSASGLVLIECHSTMKFS